MSLAQLGSNFMMYVYVYVHVYVHELMVYLLL